MRLPLAIFLLLIIGTTLFVKSAVLAQEGKTEVKARVGEFSLDISGYSSRDAAILLTTGDQTIGSSIADGDGRFRLSQIPINRGFSSFCFRQIDYRSIGESLGCMNIEPATSNVTLNDIYLPPTIGLERQSITVGSSGLAFGYSMPESDITMTLSDGSSFEETSDDTGYYSFTVGNLKVGNYSLQSKGIYQARDSLNPEQSITLRVLTSSAAFTNEGLLLRARLLGLLPWILLGTFLIALLIGFFIYKRHPLWLVYLAKNKAFIAIRKRFRRKLHHSWFMGY